MTKKFTKKGKKKKKIWAGAEIIQQQKKTIPLERENLDVWLLFFFFFFFGHIEKKGYVQNKMSN